MSRIKKQRNAPGSFLAAQKAGYHRGIIEESYRLLNEHRYVDAEIACRAVLAEAPTNADALFLLGCALFEMKRPDSAIKYLSRAVRYDSHDARKHAQLALALHTVGKSDQALRHLDRAIRLAPADPRPVYTKSTVLAESGRKEEAATVLREMLASDPENTEALYHLALYGRFRGDEPEISRIRAIATDKTAEPDVRRSSNYALGLIENEIGNYDAAIDAFAVARSFPDGDTLDLDRLRRTNDQRKAIFTAEFFSSHRDHGDPSKQPVFIVGMPRSGTTLTEQILSRHPDVAAAGELTGIDILARRIRSLAKEQTNLLNFLNRMTVQESRDLISKYLEEIRAYGGDAQRVTDKMPGNFHHLGLIGFLLPNATIIHCRRNPLDTCVSCFLSPLPWEHNYLADLRTLGTYYAEYDALMKHWESVLPGRILTVQYEDMVDHFESNARRIVDHVGLEWNDACLDFHKSDRTVRTMSTSQVRQPIYKTSIGRWKRYRNKLDPLIEALGPLAQEEIARSRADEE